MTEHPLLSRLSRFGVRLGLERMRSFLHFLGDPHLRCPVVHVAGTNGKGSVVRMVAHILGHAGYRVATTISPHLQAVNERITVGGEDIADADLTALLNELSEARTAWAEANPELGVDPDAALTYFELVTAAFFLHTARSGADVAVVEVGMGGRLDATNVVSPLVSVITSISLDHTEQLGDDIASIAAEKAGIIKPGAPVVVGPLAPAALSVIRAIAHERGALLLRPEAEYRVNPRGSTFSWSCGERSLTGLSVALAGDHQIENAGVALTAVATLAEVLPVSDEAMRQGLLTVRHPGRLERLAPNLLVDCAHNPDGAWRLAAYLRTLPWDQPRTLLFGMSGDKDTRSVLGALAPYVDKVVTTRGSHVRAADPAELARRVEGCSVPIEIGGPIEVALPAALAGGGLVIVAGSVFLAGAARELYGAS